VAAVILSLAAFAGLIVLAVAGVSGATAVLVTAGAVVGMVALGNLVGGRHTPNRAPYDPEGAESADSDGEQVADPDEGQATGGQAVEGQAVEEQRGTRER
jgi:hypothetical protein